MKTSDPARRRANAVVYNDLREKLLAGEFRAGEWISVEETSRQFKVSRQPVMEAMRRLSSDWLIEIVPQVGCRVASYDDRSIDDFMNTFANLEAHIAELAAERRTPKQLQKVKRLETQICRRSHFDETVAVLGREYHAAILESSHSAVLPRLCDQLWSFSNFVFRNISANGIGDEVFERSNAVMKRLTSAIEARDGKLALIEMRTWLTSLDGSADRQSAQQAA